MQFVIAVGGSEGEGFFRRVVEVAAVEQAEAVTLAHVIDTGPRHDMEAGRERLFARHMGVAREVDLTRAEEDRANAVLQYARRALVMAGVPDGKLREVVLRGKPNEELRRLAEDERAAIVVGGRDGKPGPHSLGKTARFLVDHAPIVAILVRET